jgi:putative endonuclease
MEKNGYTILGKNYRNSYGEIDLIARKSKDLVFLEVKTRTGLQYGYPFEAVGKSKISRIRKSANFYMAKNNLSYLDVHFNVISIVMDNEIIRKLLKGASYFPDTVLSENLYINGKIEIEYIENAF